jgi:hypothetical protein
MQLNLEELLASFVKLKKSEGVSLVSVRRDKNTLELFDCDGSDLRVEFEDWLQSLIFEEIKKECDATDWEALAQEICEEVTGSYNHLKKGETNAVKTVCVERVLCRTVVGSTSSTRQKTRHPQSAARC